MSGSHGRLDVAVATSYGVSREEAKRWIARGDVTVNGIREKASFVLGDDDVVEATVVTAPPRTEGAAAVPLDIVYEDDALLVVNKQAGIVVHPTGGSAELTLVDALAARGIPLAPAGGAERPGVVHRLDRMTSGLLLLAKTDEALAFLQEELKERAIHRRYWALVWGAFDEEDGEIDMPISRDDSHPLRRKVAHEGKHAETHFHVEERGRKATLLTVELKTGRTHQIRVHLAAIRHPVLGDSTYGRKSDGFERTCLHAVELSFTHPVSRDTIECTAPLPEDLRGALELLHEGKL